MLDKVLLTSTISALSLRLSTLDLLNAGVKNLSTLIDRQSLVLYGTMKSHVAALPGVWTSPAA